MSETLPLEFDYYATGPFDSGLVVDHTALAGDFEDFRRALVSRIPARDGRTLVVQLSDTDELKEGEEGYRRWLEGHVEKASERFGAYGLGKERRAPSLLRIDVAGEIDHPCEDELLKRGTLRLRDVRLSFHEYGIGIFSARTRIELKAAPSPDEVARLLECVALLQRSDEIQRVLEGVDRDVRAAGREAIRALDFPEPVFSREEVTDPEVRGLLWGHGVSVFDEPRGPEVPFGPFAAKLTNVARPEEVQNNCPSLGGFVFLGWGRSLLVGLAPDTRDRMLAVLRRLEYDWRVRDQFNGLFMGRLDAYADLADKTFRKRKPMRWIERATTECDLYSAYFDEHFQMLDPYAHAVAKHTYGYWRMREQAEAYRRKLESLHHVYEQEAARRARRSEQQFNALLAVITVIALSSAGVDGASALAPDYAESWPLYLRLIIVFGIPLVAILVLWRFILGAFKGDG